MKERIFCEWCEGEEMLPATVVLTVTDLEGLLFERYQLCVACLASISKTLYFGLPGEMSQSAKQGSRGCNEGSKSY
jgi:hypothetical protein